MVLIDPASARSSATSPGSTGTVASRSPAAMRRVASTAATTGREKRPASRAAAAAATARATSATTSEVAHARRRIVHLAHGHQHGRAPGEAGDGGGYRAVDGQRGEGRQPPSRAADHLPVVLEGGHVEVGGGEARRQGARDRAGRGELDHADGAEVAGPSDDVELVGEAHPRRQGAVRDGGRHRAGLTGQLGLGRREGGPPHQDEGGRRGHEHGGRHQHQHGDREAASHASRYPAPRTVVRGRSSPSLRAQLAHVDVDGALVADTSRRPTRRRGAGGG